MKRVLVDTGPLVAIMSRDDQYHQVCVQALEHLPGPLFSCWPVITEAAWLLRRHPGAIRQLLNGIASGFVELLALQSTEAGKIANVMERYKTLKPQLADAALVYLAGRDNIDTIFTLDRRDFSVYRSGKNRPFRIIPQGK